MSSKELHMHKEYTIEYSIYMWNMNTWQSLWRRGCIYINGIYSWVGSLRRAVCLLQAARLPCCLLADGKVRDLFWQVFCTPLLLVLPEEELNGSEAVWITWLGFWAVILSPGCSLLAAAKVVSSPHREPRTLAALRKYWLALNVHIIQLLGQDIQRTF